MIGGADALAPRTEAEAFLTETYRLACQAEVSDLGAAILFEPLIRAPRILHGPLEKPVALAPAITRQGEEVLRDGAVIDARVSISPLFDDGAIVGSVVALQDLSEIQDLMRTRTQDLERVSENLGRSEERITAIVENIFEGIVTIDSTGIIQWMNRAASEMFGYAAEEITGQNIKILMPEPFKREHDTYLRRYLQTGRQISSVRGARSKGGAVTAARSRWNLRSLN